MCSSVRSQRASFVFGEVLCLVRPRADGGGSFGAGDSAAAPCITILHSSRGWGASTTCSQAGVRAGLSGRLRLSSHDAEVMVVSQTHPPARSLLQPGSANPRDLSHTDPMCVWPFRVFGAGPAPARFCMDPDLAQKVDGFTMSSAGCCASCCHVHYSATCRRPGLRNHRAFIAMLVSRAPSHRVKCEAMHPDWVEDGRTCSTVQVPVRAAFMSLLRSRFGHARHVGA